MIETKEQLRRFIQADNADYFAKPLKNRLVGAFCADGDYFIMRYKTRLRKAEYYFNNAEKSRIHFLLALWHERRKNLLGQRLGIEISINCFQEGLILYHGGGIVVNPSARIGKNCRLHGGNCIGNAGNSQQTPVLGDGVDLGFGACVIGGVKLADRVTVGAGAVVVKDCPEEGAVLVGVPAAPVRRQGKDEA